MTPTQAHTHAHAPNSWQLSPIACVPMWMTCCPLMHMYGLVRCSVVSVGLCVSAPPRETHTRSIWACACVFDSRQLQVLPNNLHPVEYRIQTRRRGLRHRQAHVLHVFFFCVCVGLGFGFVVLCGLGHVYALAHGPSQFESKPLTPGARPQCACVCGCRHSQRFIGFAKFIQMSSRPRTRNPSSPKDDGQSPPHTCIHRVRIPCVHHVHVCAYGLSRAAQHQHETAKLKFPRRLDEGTTGHWGGTRDGVV